MEHSHSASPEIPCLLWNQKAHYHVLKSRPMAPIQSQTNSVHTLPSCFPKINSNIISHLCVGLPGGFFLQVSQTKYRKHFSSLMHATFPAHLILLDLILIEVCNIGALLRAVFSSLPPLPPSYVQIFSSAPCSQAPSVCILPLV